MSARKNRKLAVAILGGDQKAQMKAAKIAGAYIDLLHAAQTYYAQSTPRSDPRAKQAAINLRELLPFSTPPVIPPLPTQADPCLVLLDGNDQTQWWKARKCPLGCAQYCHFQTQQLLREEETRDVTSPSPTKGAA